MFRLEQLRIASPCHERWADMVGDDRVRLCNACDRQVFNLSELTRAEAETLFATRGVTPCVRFRRRADGTVVTADCPTGPRRRLAVWASAVAAGAALFGASPALADQSQPQAEVQATGSIRGVVKDAGNGEPLLGATVIVSGAALTESLAEITDENGAYVIAGLPPGDYLVTIYYDETTTELRDVRVTLGDATLANAEIALDKVVIADGAPRGRTTIPFDSGYTMGPPPLTREFGPVIGATETTPEVLVSAPPPPPHRPTIEWSLLARVGYGFAEDQHWEAALGADISIPVARDGDLRLGAWTEVRTSSGAVLGVESLLEVHGDILALRVGGNRHVVTAAAAFGHLRGVRLVASANRALDDPHDWSATAGIELELVGAFRYLLRR